ncbi:polyprenyl synthetase family protein [Candidatus Uabimicrobium amorphum]|uniref:Farnesyl-diphosphate synthase n=1 Tax=Uabimicrobium amorphum TaxID=2596890 RepID=A0A5S9F5W7_UABAM|nr:farnesyl diphosphate synthase [Candidatus Uabimicrobium amorphum]BBM86019.1 farnesyl-diphosphate synthase [Candidatus Uabimicrobium amorphum]
MEYPQLITKTRTELEEFLSNAIPQQQTNTELLLDAMRYSVLGGGKRLRGIITIAICRLLGGEDANCFPTASAIEIIHAYSLVHDDLPAMDNDDYRRGKLSTHKKYGEDMGILAGDALLTYAFWIIASKTKDKSIVPQLVEDVSFFSGLGGMVAGQVNDIKNENKEISFELLNYIHRHKTGALISLAAKCGATCAKASESRVKSLESFGAKIGLAFQIMDDILDVTSTSEKMGKKVGKDSDKGKNTYPKFLGVEESRKHAEKLISEAKELILDIPNAGFLEYLADYVVNREN